MRYTIALTVHEIDDSGDTTDLVAATILDYATNSQIVAELVMLDLAERGNQLLTNATSFSLTTPRRPGGNANV